MEVMIDVPSPFASLQEWTDYRESLDKIAGTDELKREADEQIEKLKRG